jgi:hypothetical protein
MCFSPVAIESANQHPPLEGRGGSNDMVTLNLLKFSIPQSVKEILNLLLNNYYIGTFY